MDVQSVLVADMHTNTHRFTTRTAPQARFAVAAGGNNNRANNNANSWRAGA